MRGSTKLRLILAVLAGALVAWGVSLALSTPFGRRQPGTTAPLIQNVIPAGCERDPANLPVPTGPEGRPANYLHACGSRLLDSQGREVRIGGVNWSGMEYSGYSPGGLGNRNWQEILDQVAALGYNTVRLPFSSEGLDPNNRVQNVDFTLNPDLQGLSGLEMIDRLVAGARERGLKVILDRHQPTSATKTNLWYSKEVPEDQWIAQWRTLAARYRGNDTVIAVDLHNEPHGQATWGSGDPATDWRLAAERAGNAVLEANPYVLVFVEGIENYQGDQFWWGGNLLGAREYPVRLSVPGRLVYSPHDYGPSVSGQAMFWDPRFPSNLPGEWDRHWGYLQREGITPVVVGEFGGLSFGDDPDGKWQRALIAYLRERGIGALVWALNPSWDTGGIFGGDWQTIDPVKEQGYRAIMAAPLDVGPSGTFGKARERPRVLSRQEDTGNNADETVFRLRLMNDGPTSLDPSRVEVRYWFRTGDPSITPEKPSVEAGDFAGGGVQAEYVAVSGPNPPIPPDPPSPRGRGEETTGASSPTGQPAPQERGEETATADARPDHYLRVTFGSEAKAIDKYRASGVVTIRFKKPGPNPPPNAGDYSFAGPPPKQNDRYLDWDRVALYVDGQLVWGREP